MNVERIPGLINRFSPATDEQVAALGQSLGLLLPTEYVDLLRTANGILADLVCFYSAEEVPERNQTYQVAKYAPGYILIGSANDFPLLIRAGESSAVLEADWGAMTQDCMSEIAPSLAAWIEAGCPLRDADSPEPPEHVDVYLIRAPKGGIRRLREVCAHLNLSIPLTKVKEILEQIPHRLCHDVPYLPWARLVAETSKSDPCLGVFAVDSPDEPVSLPPWEWK